MAKRKPAKTKSAESRKRTQVRTAKPGPRALPEPLLARVRSYCRANAPLMVVVGTYFDQLYASDVLELRRRVSLGIEPARDIEFITTVNGELGASRKLSIVAQPASWIATQEWSIDPTSWRHQRLRLLAALHEFEDNILPTLNTPRFISDNARCALYLTWLLCDDGVEQLRPHTSSCQALPWSGDHGRQRLAEEWLNAKRVAKWGSVLARSFEILGESAPERRDGSVSVLFKQAAKVGEVAMLGGENAGFGDADAVTFVAHTMVKLTASDLRSFDSASQPLAHIGGYVFRCVPAFVDVMSAARAGGLGFIDDDSWVRIHSQSRLALEFAIRCVGGLGPRLLATGLVPNAMQIEKRAGEIVTEIKQLELLQNGVAPGERLYGVIHTGRIQLLAHELAHLGAGFADVSPAAELEGLRRKKLPEHYDIPLTEPALLIAAVLCRQPPDHGLTAAELVVEVHRAFGTKLDETTVKKTINGQLKPWGAKNSKGVGYHVPSSRRLELWTRIQPTLAVEYPHRRADS